METAAEVRPVIAPIAVNELGSMTWVRRRPKTTPSGELTQRAVQRTLRPPSRNTAPKMAPATSAQAKPNAPKTVRKA